MATLPFCEKRKHNTVMMATLPAAAASGGEHRVELYSALALDGGQANLVGW